jgi:L-lactate dehydrogenase complex protein LldG
MSTSREQILRKLRTARQPFPDAPPRPKPYLPVTRLADDEDLLARFTAEVTRLDGEVFVVASDKAACNKVLELLAGEQAILAWDWAHIPSKGLPKAIEEAGIEVIQPAIHTENRAEVLDALERIPVGLTGAAGVIATTGTLVVQAGPGTDRITTVLPRRHIAVIEQKQIVPRFEDWVAQQRVAGLDPVQMPSNVCFISGPSRTADIEKNLVLGMHGPEKLQIVIKKARARRARKNPAPSA